MASAPESYGSWSGFLAWRLRTGEPRPMGTREPATIRHILLQSTNDFGKVHGQLDPQRQVVSGSRC